MKLQSKAASRKFALIKFGDMAGMAASALCLVHCLAMPLVMLAFPMLGLAHTHDTFHDVLVAFVTLPVLLALIPGYLRHRDKTTLIAGCTGLGCFLLAVFVVSPLFGELAEAALAVVSGFLLLYAHLRNRRSCKRCSVREKANDEAKAEGKERHAAPASGNAC